MKIICIARNYAEHAKELKNEIPQNPVFFMKPDSAILQKGRDLYIPEFTQNLQYELEIVLKISKSGKYIQTEFAHNYFEQFSLGIDFTARDLQSQLKEKGHPWEISKAFDNSAVIGEFFDKKDWDMENLNFELKQNGITVQRGNSQDMLFKYSEIIAHASQYFTLKTGDLIYTGTPAGVGKVEPNDLLEAYCEDKKVLEFTIK